MIRIRTILYKISFSFIFLCTSTMSYAQITMGARGVALGHATTALAENEWALFSNPALLPTKTSTIGFYGLRNYGFAELTDIASYSSIRTKFGITALGFHRYGDNLFNETRARIGYKNEWENLHVGLAITYNHIAFGGPYGSGGAVGFDIGLAAQVIPQLWIGAKSTNINKPVYHFSGNVEDIPRDISIGFSYMLEERALLLMDVVKDVRFPVSYRGGLEVFVIDNLKGRIGVTTEPLTYSFGMGYGKDFWEVNIAIQQHQLLGMSPGLDLLIRF